MAKSNHSIFLPSLYEYKPSTRPTGKFLFCDLSGDDGYSSLPCEPTEFSGQQCEVNIKDLSFIAEEKISNASNESGNSDGIPSKVFLGLNLKGEIQHRRLEDHDDDLEDDDQKGDIAPAADLHRKRSLSNGAETKLQMELHELGIGKLGKLFAVA